jgi:hypothetical protein
LLSSAFMASIVAPSRQTRTSRYPWRLLASPIALACHEAL